MNPAHSFSNRRVLVVDDNATIHEDFKKILTTPATAESEQLNNLESALFEDAPAPKTRNGFEIESAFQGEEALAKVQSAVAAGNPYALAFIDMRMPPGWDGVETIEQIWRADPNLQIVICTAYSDYSWEEILRQLGQRHNLMVLKKPFDNIEVVQICEMLTQKWSMNQQLQPPPQNPDAGDDVTPA